MRSTVNLTAVVKMLEQRGTASFSRWTLARQRRAHSKLIFDVFASLAEYVRTIQKDEPA